MDRRRTRIPRSDLARYSAAAEPGEGSFNDPPGGCAYLHWHQGPGIRCLIEGGIRIDTDGHSTSYGPGCAWYEAGPAPAKPVRCLQW